MREFKFIVWDAVLEEMMYSKREDFDDMIGFRFNRFETGVPIITQWTGLKDMAGVEIYEGDVIEFIGWDGASRGLYKVMYMQGSSGFAGYAPGKYLTLNNSEQGVKVVGNIFENPELIEEKNKA